MGTTLQVPPAWALPSRIPTPAARSPGLGLRGACLLVVGSLCESLLLTLLSEPCVNQAQAFQDSGGLRDWGLRARSLVCVRHSPSLSENYSGKALPSLYAPSTASASVPPPAASLQTATSTRSPGKPGRWRGRPGAQEVPRPPLGSPVAAPPQLSAGRAAGSLPWLALRARTGILALPGNPLARRAAALLESSGYS